jgi:hypothetical protein
VGFFLVLQGPQLADRPGKLELGLLHSGQNILSPLVHVSVPLQKEEKDEFVTSCVQQKWNAFS